MTPQRHIGAPDYVYPVDEWRLVEKRFYPRFLAQAETFFTTANGYLGIRGACDEGAPAFQNGTFVNGFYESWPIVYGEEAYGFAKTGQTIVNVTDAKVIRLYVDDEPFFLPTANLIEFERVLDMQAGIVERSLVWETAAGKRVSIRSRRLVSFPHRHLAAIAYEVTVLNGEAPVVVSSEIVNRQNHAGEDDDPRRKRGFAHRVLLPRVHYARELRILMSHATANSDMRLACGVDHAIATDCPHSYEVHCSEDDAKVVLSVDAKPGVPIHLVKFLTYHTSRSAEPAELCERAERTLERAAHHGFDDLVAEQRRYLDDFWERSDVQISGAPDLQQTLRFNLFHILQASGRAEGTGIAAKGLTGQGYEGHFFWDSEIYVLPFLIYTEPRIARNLLKFRHGYLEKARERAREVNQKGALFPWRTINGDEASAYYAAGTAQYHIDADIAYALRKYVNATGDVDFLHREGAEILVETARLWRDLGFFSERRGGQFCIAGVTGPDEYNTVVNNNTFTNLMARENLWYAAETVEAMQRSEPERYAALVDKTGLEAPESAEWRRAADRMFVAVDEKLGIHLQDDAFLDKKPWDLEKTPPERFPLLLHYHPLVIYRHRVIKQADVVLAMFLLGDEFSREEKKRNFDFYDGLTTGDSSLSACVQGILAFELGYTEKASEYARHAALVDLADAQGNAADGCHIASMGGTWMLMVYGIAGFRDHGGCFSFHPSAMARDVRVRFPLRIRGSTLEVDFTSESVTYTLREGDELVFCHHDAEIRLSKQEPVAVRKRSRG